MRGPTLVFVSVLVVLILLCYSGYSFSQGIVLGDQKIGKGPIKIRADKLEFDRQKNIYITQGNVEIIQDNRVLKADMIKVNPETREAEAEGNITLTSGEDILKSDRIEINLDTQKGTVYDGELFFKRENFHLTGKRIEKLGEDSYRIIDGVFTTCDGPAPPWKFTGKDVNVTVEGYATVKHATFYIKDIPVLYVPYIIFPAKTKRQTGFLIPSLGYSNDGGTEVTIPFFLAISENMDATFSLDYRSERGVGEALKYRYIRSRDSFGDLYFYHMRETSSYRDWRKEQKGEELISGPDRWMLRYKHEENFDPSFFAKVDIAQVSDRDFLSDFGKVADDRSQEKLESTVFATKVWQRFNLNSEFRYTEDLEKEDKTTLQRLPRIEFSGSKQSLLGSPLFYGLTTSLDNLWREEGLTGQRIDIYPKMLYTFYTNYFEVKPEIGVRETAYTLHEGEDKVHTREIYDFNLGLTTAFQRVFDVEGETVKRLKHSIKPEVTYTFIPNVDQEGLPEFDSDDRIARSNSVTYSLTSDLIGKVFEGIDNSYYHKFVRLKLSQSYDFIEATGDLISSTDSHRHFFPVSGELDVYPNRYISLKLDGQYDTYESHFTTHNVLMGLKDERGDSLDFEYRNTRDQNEDINTKMKVKVSDSTDLNIENRYSKMNNLSLETIFGVDYRAQCWGARVTYSDRAIEDEDRREQRFMIMFSLTGLGKFGE
ncbi:MAG: LPS assembly protein LptD [Pseudomonadota bacterium]